MLYCSHQKVKCFYHKDISVKPHKIVHTWRSIPNRKEWFSMNIALLGFGTVGSHFYQLCADRTDLHVSAVLSRRPRPALTCAVTADYDELVRDPSIDIVVEVMGGVEPAYSYLCAAMRAGKHVVTANKQLMCAHFDELTALAGECGVALRCTAAAGGGIPWLTSLSRAAQLDEITAVEGILNGTTNYMLSAMTDSGADYAAALAQAQALGYAEADPTADVEGLDARRKLVLSADLAFGVNVKEEDIPCAGISSVTAADIARAKAEGLTYKLIARAEKTGGAVAAFVCPTLFSAAAPEAHTGGTGNLVSLYAARFGKQSFSGAGAGGWPTGSNVLRDCLDIAAGCRGFYADAFAPSPVELSGARGRWLFRSAGEYFTRECSAREAFDAYEAYRRNDPHALIARYAAEEE